MITSLRAGSGPDDGGALRRTHRQHEAVATFNDAPLVVGPPGWTERGNCNRISAEAADRLFYTYTPTQQQPTSETMLLCGPCPVRQDCLAAGRDELDGVWGGLLPQQRWALFGKPTDLKYSTPREAG